KNIQTLDQDEILRQKYLARGPGDAATKAYIASKYLSEDSTKKKKRKKNSKKSFGIIDEEDSSWVKEAEENLELKRIKEEEDRFESEAKEGEMVRGIASNWQTIREGDEFSPEMGEDQPVIVGDNTPRMSNGQKAGVLTKEEIKIEAEKSRQAERRALERLQKESQGESEETIYRDTSGRKIDPKIKKAEEARKRKEKVEREAQRMEWGKGLVQRRAAEEEKRRLIEEKDKPMARYVDDVELNEELKEKERWNDPAAGFLTKKETKGKGRRLVRPTYKGAWKPNRFMIAPGYRWDGVDRSTGYEDKLLLQKNQAKSLAAEAHAWSTEDM
ncbi:Pre-mRNA-splicing factor cwc26, partial [Rhizopus stolonifer]